MAFGARKTAQGIRFLSLKAASCPPVAGVQLSGTLSSSLPRRRRNSEQTAPSASALGAPQGGSNVLNGHPTLTAFACQPPVPPHGFPYDGGTAAVMRVRRGGPWPSGPQ